MFALHHKLLRDLIHMRGQMLAVTAVLACGVATYVTMRAAYDSLGAARDDYYSTYRFADVFAHVKRAPESLPIAAIPGVAAVETRIVMDVTAGIEGLNEPATARLVSIPDRGQPLLNRVFIRSGRYIEPGRRDEVLISEAFAEANGLSVGNTIDAVINGTWERLRIVGVALSPEYVYEVRPGEVFPDNRRFGIVWMGREAMAAAFNMTGAFNDLALSLTKDANEPELIARLDQMLERYGSLGAYGRDDQMSARFIRDELTELRVMGIILPSIFLAVVAFLLHVLMSRLVGTERPQIAVLKAFGYRRWEIALHYLQLSMLAVLPGSVIGIAGGLWLAYGLTGIYEQYFHFPQLALHAGASLPLLAVGIAGGAAILGTLSAVRSAVVLAPAEAMRPPAPEKYHAGVLERTPLFRRFSPALRMISRNLARRPWKAAASALGIALAVSILVVGRFSIDSVNYIANLQFDVLQREDVTVMFQEPKPHSALYALAKLPGVLRAEPIRDVGVRLRFGHRVKRTAIVGLNAESSLRPLFNQAMKQVKLPREGIVLNSALAESLGARAGDEIDVEVLEGERPHRRLFISALLDEPVGFGAYMDDGALSRMMGESGSLSGALLSVDPRQEARLYLMLKQTPAIAGVSVKRAAVDSFWESYGETIWISTTMLVGFAAVIAFGIVYNGARIALSERGHELASLRVLGYTKMEIGTILLGEQVLLTVLAMPVGLLIGYYLASWVSSALSRELFRLPLIIGNASYAYAIAVVAVASLMSGLAVARRLAWMDLTAVLKSRE